MRDPTGEGAAQNESKQPVREPTGKGKAQGRGQGRRRAAPHLCIPPSPELPALPLPDPSLARGEPMEQVRGWGRGKGEEGGRGGVCLCLKQRLCYGTSCL